MEANAKVLITKFNSMRHDLPEGWLSYDQNEAIRYTKNAKIDELIDIIKKSRHKNTTYDYTQIFEDINTLITARNKIADSYKATGRISSTNLLKPTYTNQNDDVCRYRINKDTPHLSFVNKRLFGGLNNDNDIYASIAFYQVMKPMKVRKEFIVIPRVGGVRNTKPCNLTHYNISVNNTDYITIYHHELIDYAKALYREILIFLRFINRHTCLAIEAYENGEDVYVKQIS